MCLCVFPLCAFVGLRACLSSVDVCTRYSLSCCEIAGRLLGCWIMNQSMGEKQSHTAAAACLCTAFTLAQLDEWSPEEAHSNKAETPLSPPQQPAINHKILFDMWSKPNHPIKVQIIGEYTNRNCIYCVSSLCQVEVHSVRQEEEAF